jgi:hypothetical protein
MKKDVIHYGKGGGEGGREGGREGRRVEGARKVGCRGNAKIHGRRKGGREGRREGAHVPTRQP